MKIIVLNYPQMCVDVIPVSETDCAAYGGEEDFDDVNFLSDYGYSPNEIHWMVSLDDPDDVPVFWEKEEIPYATL